MKAVRSLANGPKHKRVCRDVSQHQSHKQIAEAADAHKSMVATSGNSLCTISRERLPMSPRRVFVRKSRPAEAQPRFNIITMLNLSDGTYICSGPMAACMKL